VSFSQVVRKDSNESNVAKFIFSSDTAVAEAVLYKYPTYKDRTVICCSTQSGCPVGCRFCGAGDSFVRSLTADEIVEQVDRCIAETNVEASSIDKLQIMFMSMGEPALNQKALVPAIRTLNEKYPQAALLISTSAPGVSFIPIFDISIEIPNVGLQFSVHESTDEARDKLIPMRGKYNLQEISELGQAWFWETGRKPYFNYCAHDENSSDEDADRLLALFRPDIFECTISVICERNDGMPAKNDHQVFLAEDFSSKMLARGYNVRVFDPAGQDDIGGGCGQLWFVQDWMDKNPLQVRKSAGRGLPVIHTPRI
jgi:23S rRNA (adenine2503-C2)-methyltransferase